MPEPFSVLVFTKTVAYRHESIAAGVRMFRRLADLSQSTDHPFVVQHSEDAEAFFTVPSLSRFRVIVLMHTSGVFLTAEQLAALAGYVSSGQGGLVGIHAALGGMQSATVDPDGYYGRLLGGVLTEHPVAQVGRAVIKAPTHPIVQPFLKRVAPEDAECVEPSFSHFDEWYNYQPTCCSVTASRAPAAMSGLDLLLVVDEASYKGGKHGDNHPTAWTWPDFDATGTRVYYTALGHYAESYEDDVFCAHLRNAVLWVAKRL